MVAHALTMTMRRSLPSTLHLLPCLEAVDNLVASGQHLIVDLAVVCLVASDPHPSGHHLIADLAVVCLVASDHHPLPFVLLLVVVAMAFRVAVHLVFCPAVDHLVASSPHLIADLAVVCLVASAHHHIFSPSSVQGAALSTP